MKQFNKESLPLEIVYKKQVYKLDTVATEELKRGVVLARGYHVQVNVLHRNLRGREDFHGKPYKPTVWVYSNELGAIKKPAAR